MDHITDPVLAGERHLRDPGHVHALRRQQHHLRPPPGHHRPTVAAHDPHQPATLFIIDLTHPQAFHGPVWRIGLCRQCAPPANVTLQRH